MEEPYIDPGPLVANQQAVESLQQAVSRAPMNLNSLRLSIKRVMKENAWMDRIDPERGARWKYAKDEFEDFVRDDFPKGLKSDPDTIRRLLGDDTEERMLFEQLMKRKPGAPLGNTNASKAVPETNDSIRNNCFEEPLPQKRESPVGTTIGYAVRKLTKDRPDLLERVKAGEMSANRAMIEAGFRKVKSPGEWLRHWWKRATKQEREAFMDEVGTEGW